ncbi:hypothetical protein X765_32025 [Mesorhizobium sp. LSHC440B00]|nr:hypothetical protein X765_32025 [Mesorhizobium sp. LSHC440B00]
MMEIMKSVMAPKAMRLAIKLVSFFMLGYLFWSTHSFGGRVYQWSYVAMFRV